MTDLSALPWKDFITLGAALLGAGLGIMNTWAAISARRVHLRVRPAFATSADGQEMFSIEVVNLSNFPLTVSEIGFSLNWRDVDKGLRAAVPQPVVIDGKPWPRRLEAREAVSLYFHLPTRDQNGRKIGKAYARTSCGEVCYGTSPALRQLREMVRA